MLHIVLDEPAHLAPQENLGDSAPKDVVPPHHDGTPRTAKYQAALDGGHDVLVLISEVWGGFSPEAMRFLGELLHADVRCSRDVSA